MVLTSMVPGRACRPGSLRTTNSALSTSSAMASSLVSSASTVAASAFSKCSAFLVQQQLAQTVQHRGRLLVGHRHRDQQGNRPLVAGKGVSRAADRHGAAQIAFRTVVQPDALTEVQRRIVHDVANEGGIDSANFFQTRPRSAPAGSADRWPRRRDWRVSLSSFSASLCLLSHQQRTQLFRGSGGLAAASGDRVIAQHMGQLDAAGRGVHLSWRQSRSPHRRSALRPR